MAASPELKNRHQKYERTTRLRRAYGLTAGEYDQMLEAQKGVCAICQQPETTVRRGVVMRLSIDHCHTSGRKRGLLCNRCNRALGLLGDDPALIQKLLRYLNAA